VVLEKKKHPFQNNIQWLTFNVFFNDLTGFNVKLTMTKKALINDFWAFFKEKNR
jgi:hypothetical protein